MNTTHYLVALSTPSGLPSGTRFRLDGATLREWLDRRHYRRGLARLMKIGPHMIDDVGLTLEQVRQEIAKPFWQE
jgi:uncharacterized protein YjiS (DUF1127 family)